MTESDPGLDWKTRAAQRKQAQLDSIPSEWIIHDFPLESENVMEVPGKCGLLSARELEITNTTDVEVILKNLSSSEWSSVETNCLTEIFVEKALHRAKELDDILKKTGKVVGPLHGLPMSLKDQFAMKGLETIMGYVAWIGRYAKSDCVLVEILYDCGAVPFVRTNVPQTLMWGETYNHVFGRTLNPYNRLLTAGGSSGGEGALVAMKGSPLGVGTDVGGSLRIPSAFCGLYTLRPSYERLPYYGATNALEGQESISSVLGPMTNSITGLKIFVKAIIDSQPWKRDPLVVRKEWSEKEYQLAFHGGGNSPLCFAIMWDNGVVKPHPPLHRAMVMTKEALEAAGHRVIVWEPHRHLEIYKNSETIFVADGGEDYRTECERSGEPLIKSLIPENDGYEPIVEKPFVHHLVGESYHRSAYQLWQLHKEKRELRKSHLDYWEATVHRTGTGRPVDGIISPAVAYPAVPHGLNIDSFYTTLCNAMDYTTSVFPVTFVDTELDHPHDPHEFYSYEDEAVYQLYDSGLFQGCPVGLQLIGRTQEEEAVIRMTEIIDIALKENKMINTQTDTK